VSITARWPLTISLAVAWLNFLLTSKWAALPGALNGWKRPWYGVALGCATVFVLTWKREGPPRLQGLGTLFVLGWLWLGFLFLWTFPPSTWPLIPFSDDWVPRLQATADAVSLLRHGAVVGWQWAFLGGYYTSGDLGQTLTLLGALPMTLLGDRIGYHVLHAILLAGIPWMVYLDLKTDGRREVAYLGGFFALICTAGMFGTIIPSGDTNAIAGVFCAMLALRGSSMARLGSRIGGAMIALGLTLALYSHTAFFLYTGLYLVVEAVFYRDWRMLARAAAAGTVAAIAAAPQYIELILYPRFYITNNVIYAPGPIRVADVAREIYYNAEILLHPHRWFNDYLSLTNVFLVLIAWVAARGDRSRPQVYAWLVLATVVLLRLNVREVGFLFAREMHMTAALTPAPLAWFVVTQCDRRLALAMIAVVGLYVQTGLVPIKHIRDVREFDAALIDRVSGLDGHLVLFESSPHLDLNAEPGRQSERTPFEAHVEALLPAATGRLFYGQSWDTWHWTPLRGQVVAAGAFRGTYLARTPIDAFSAEMRKWGVRQLMVWSSASKAYLDAAPAAFARVWTHGRWAQYELFDADTRAVVAEAGQGTLEQLTPLGGTVRLSDTRQGSRIVVRTNYFPAWNARAGTADVPLFASDGQLAFRAPRDGSYDVTLEYPRRGWLQVVSVAMFILGSAAFGWRRGRVT
jgi:hypothetical protein